MFTKHQHNHHHLYHHFHFNNHHITSSSSLSTFRSLHDSFKNPSLFFSLSTQHSSFQLISLTNNLLFDIRPARLYMPFCVLLFRWIVHKSVIITFPVWERASPDASQKFHFNSFKSSSLLIQRRSTIHLHEGTLQTYVRNGRSYVI